MEIENSTENENWLLNLIDSNQKQITDNQDWAVRHIRALEQRIATLEAQCQLLTETLNQFIQIHNRCDACQKTI